MNDTLLAIPTMLLVGGGAAIDWFGFAPVFAGIAARPIFAILLCFSLLRI